MAAPEFANKFVSPFSRLVGDLLDGLSMVFDDCPATQIALKAYQDNVRGNENVELKIIQNWHETMSPYYQYLLDHGTRAFVPVIDDIIKKNPPQNMPTMVQAMMEYAKINMMPENTAQLQASKQQTKQAFLERIFKPVFLIVNLNLKTKWNDPDLNEESRETLLVYMMHMNAFAIMHHIIPVELMGAAKEKGLTMLDRIQNGHMQMDNPATIKQLGGELYEALPADQMEFFTKNLDKLVLALRMFGGEADTATIFQNLVGPLTGVDASTPEGQQQSEVMQSVLGMMKNIPPETFNQGLTLLQNLPPGAIQEAMSQMQQGDGDMNFQGLLTQLMGVSAGLGGSDGPANPWGGGSGGGGGAGLGGLDINALMGSMLNNLKNQQPPKSG